MSSLQMGAVAAVLRLTRKRAMATPERARRRLAAPKGSPAPPAALGHRHAVTQRGVGGFPCTTVAPRGGPAARAAVYLHGGAYVSAVAPQHWALVSAMADAGVRVEVPHYGLAPQHTHRQAYPFVTAVYRELLRQAEAKFAAADAAQAAGDTVKWARLMEEGRSLIEEAVGLAG